MNALARQMMVVSRKFLGPAGPSFLTGQLVRLGLTLESVGADHLPMLASNAQRSAGALMQTNQAAEFAEALLACRDLAQHADGGADPEVGSDLAERVLEVATDYVGPAAARFLERELRAIGVTEGMPIQLVRPLAERIRHSARSLMDPNRAEEFADRVVACGAANGGLSRQPVIDMVRKPTQSSPPATGSQMTNPPSFGFVADTALINACRTLRGSLSLELRASASIGLLILGTAGHVDCARIAAGLSGAIAEEGTSTLLVDTDLANPQVERLFGLEGHRGLAEALTDELPVLVPERISSHLSVITAGQRPADETQRVPSRLSELAKRLGERFQCVIYLVSSRATRNITMLAPHVRGAVLVVRLGIDTAESVGDARQTLERAGVRILGFAPLEMKARRSTIRPTFGHGRAHATMPQPSPAES